jgi:hypothetical protein
LNFSISLSGKPVFVDLEIRGTESDPLWIADFYEIEFTVMGFFIDIQKSSGSRVMKIADAGHSDYLDKGVSGNE